MNYTSVVLPSFEITHFITAGWMYSGEEGQQLGGAAQAGLGGWGCSWGLLHFLCQVAMATQLGWRSHNSQRADSCFCWIFLVCSWLHKGHAEMVHQGKVWKSQLGRGQCGKEELEGRDRMWNVEVSNAVWTCLRKLREEQVAGFGWLACAWLCLEGLGQVQPLCLWPGWHRVVWGTCDGHLRAAKTPLCFIPRGRFSPPWCLFH